VSREGLISFLSEELPYIWRDAYLLHVNDGGEASVIVSAQVDIRYKKEDSGR
jgi:hypothetical protein